MSGSRGKPDIAANITIRYKDEATACTVWRAVSPDNFQTPQGITIEAVTVGCELRVSIVCSRGLGSLIATLDDLLSCIQAAETAIGGVRG